MNYSTKQIKNEPVDKVAGIFNYCDRWCEECNYTHKCTLFKVNDKQLPDKPLNYWNDIDVHLEEFAELKDLTLKNENLKVDTSDYNKLKAKKVIDKFQITLNNWLKNLEVRFGESFVQLNGKSDQEKLVVNGLFILKRYADFLPLKAQCIFYAYDEPLLVETGFQKGSAKIALIVIERSLKIYALLEQGLPDDKKACQFFKKLLSELKSRILIEYPDAMAFIRPGLDEAV